MEFRFIFTCFFLTIISFVATAQTGTSADTVSVGYGDSSENKIFEKVDIEASFPGGEIAWRTFLERNLNASVATENGAPAGRFTVWVQFVVDKEGNITDVKALTNNGYGMEEEVVRLIKKGPQWQPASQHGRMVKAYRKQPVTFMIEDDGFVIISEEPFVFFTGINNSITINANKVKSEDLEVTISQGSIISKGNGSYTVRVNKSGRVIVQLFNKKHKNIGAASFEVKPKGQSSALPNTIKG